MLLDKSCKNSFKKIAVTYEVRHDAIDYLSDIPPEVISIVHQFKTFDQFEKWLDYVFGDMQIGGQFTQEAFSYLEILALLFGFESKPDKGLLDSKASILKNRMISESDKRKIYDLFYDPENYTGVEDIGDVVDTISILLSRVRSDQNNFKIFSRIKQYGSLYRKMKKFISKVLGSEKAGEPVSIADVIEQIKAKGIDFSGHASEYLDDMIGFNFIIDDTGMDRQSMSEILTGYSNQVETILRSHPGITIEKTRKESRVTGFEAVNIFVHGLLKHRIFGDLPIKIQFRFKTALLGESAMYYGYKKYGLWEIPPWAKGIDIRKIKTFRELQEILFDNFKRYSASSVPSRVFSLREHLTPREGWPSLLDLNMPDI